jgi:UDP-glucose 4-epimerase
LCLKHEGQDTSSSGVAINALVTGGAGFIGSHLVHRLLAEGHSVVVLDDLSAGCEDDLPHNALLVEGDVRDRDTLRKLFSSVPVELLFHLAASFANERSVEDPEHDLSVNGLGTLRIVQEASRAKALRRVVYASTSCVYGNAVHSLREDDALKPGTPYAASKLLGEHYLRHYENAFALPVVVLRLFNCFGPAEPPTARRGVVARFIDAALHGDPIVIRGTGLETRDFTYVADVVDAMMLASSRDGTRSGTYNIASGRTTSIDQLAEAVLVAADSSSAVEYRDQRNWDTVIDRKADVSRAAIELRFSAKVPLERGLAYTVAWARGHELNQLPIGHATVP